MNKCVQKDCVGNIHARGLCKHHYNQFRNRINEFVSPKELERSQQIWLGIVNELGISGSNFREIGF